MNKKLVLLIIGGIISLALAIYSFVSIITNDPLPPQEPSSQVETTTGPIAYITGAVAKPGLYAIESTSSLGDLVKSAGGLVSYADTQAINLAEPVEPGSHIHIPFHYTGNPESLLRGNQININTASEKDFDALPGIGSTMAKRIIDYRNEHGNFDAIEDLKKVKGIGDGVFKKFADKVTT